MERLFKIYLVMATTYFACGLAACISDYLPSTDELKNRLKNYFVKK